MAPVLPPQPLVDAANFFEPILVPELNAMQILSVEQLRASTLATFKKKKKMRNKVSGNKIFWIVWDVEIKDQPSTDSYIYCLLFVN